eukprot:g50401.t1
MRAGAGIAVRRGRHRYLAVLRALGVGVSLLATAAYAYWEWKRYLQLTVLAKRAIELPLPRSESGQDPPLNPALLRRKLTLRDVDVGGKVVLVRVDYNVPLDENGAVLDSRRIDETVETLSYLLTQHLPARPPPPRSYHYSTDPVTRRRRMEMQRRWSKPASSKHQDQEERERAAHSTHMHSRARESSRTCSESSSASEWGEHEQAEPPPRSNNRYGSREQPTGREQVRCIVVMSHLGRPGLNFDRNRLSLRPCVSVLQSKLPVGTEVRFLDRWNEQDGRLEWAVQKAPPGTVILLENLRFYPEETGLVLERDADEGSGRSFKSRTRPVSPSRVQRFRDRLSDLADVYVLEAFGCAHRHHSSISGLRTPVRVAGLAMQQEMNCYATILHRPERPFLAILGGAKVSDKRAVLEHLLGVADEIIIGGGLAYTFKKVVEGVSIGLSLFDEQSASFVQEVVRRAAERRVKLHFPTDHVVADHFSEKAQVGVADDQAGVPEGWMALDVGPRSLTRFARAIRNAQTILWFGPLGVYEKGPFGAGTLACMWELVAATQRGARTVIGGGELSDAATQLFANGRPVSEQVWHCSTGGAASLALLEGKLLPGIATLSDISPDTPRTPAPV